MYLPERLFVNWKIWRIYHVQKSEIT